MYTLEASEFLLAIRNVAIDVDAGGVQVFVVPLNLII